MRGGIVGTIRQLTIAIIGLGFGAEFLPIYLCHPNIKRVVLVDADAPRREAIPYTSTRSKREIAPTFCPNP